MRIIRKLLLSTAILVALYSYAAQSQQTENSNDKTKPNKEVTDDTLHTSAVIPKKRIDY
jgi:hypothetical protein